MSRISFVLFLFIAIHCRFGFSSFHHSKGSQLKTDDESLILTPLLKENKIEEAKQASSVDPTLFLGVKSHAGYFTVDEAFNSNLFFWMFPSENDYENDPVILWLEGGPGESTMFSIFTQHGPFQFTREGDMFLREYSWNRNHTVLYIDNPVGTGFSFTDEGGYAQNQTKVADSLYSCLQQFFKLFPELQDNDFFVTGESYGGKYVPSLSHKIHKSNPTADLKIHLRGLAISSGWSDPINQVGAYADYLYNLGLVDGNAKEVIVGYQNRMIAYINQGNYAAAAQEHKNLFLNSTGTFLEEISGVDNVYNYLHPKYDETFENHYKELLTVKEIKAALHVGSRDFNNGRSSAPYQNLFEDIMKSVASLLGELICNYPVLLYNGQVDIVVAYPTTVNFLKVLDSCSHEDYLKAERKIWYVNDELAGYTKVAGNLTEVLVLYAGHMVSTDQPKWGYDLIYKFVRNQPIA